jgi:hypothetical protein
MRRTQCIDRGNTRPFAAIGALMERAAEVLRLNEADSHITRAEHAISKQFIEVEKLRRNKHDPPRARHQRDIAFDGARACGYRGAVSACGVIRKFEQNGCLELRKNWKGRWMLLATFLTRKIRCSN